MAKSTDSAQIQYLKQDKIGKVIAQGLSQLYQEKPQKPVTYLAHWLLAFSENMKKTETVEKHQQSKLKAGESFHKTESVKAQLVKKQTIRREQEASVLKTFQKQLSSHEYHLELLAEQFPEFLEKSKHFTGVYIGELNHPPKEVTEEDTDENAHLQTDVPKVINYIGSSKSHKNLMIGKTLPLDKGVTAEAFGLTLEQPAEGEEKKKKFVYVPDVIKNEKIHYFRIPKLGAYIAIPLIFKSYLFEHMFDTALEEQKKYLHQKDEFMKQKQAQLVEINNEIQEARHRLQGHTQKNETEQIAAVEQEVKDLQQKKIDKEKEELEYTEPELQARKKELVVCADTLGQDRQITEQQQEFLVHFVKLFKNQFEKNEMKLLKQDVSLQIAYEQSLGKTFEELDEELKKQLEIDEEKMKQLTETYKEEKLINYHADNIRLEKLKEQLARPQTMQWFLKLSEFRTVKFPSLLQHMLYFLGYEKADVDIPHTTHLNWKKVRKELPSQGPTKKLLSYEYKGAKPNPVKNYAKVSYLLSVFQKYAEEEVSRYNVALGIALKIMKLLLALRKEDVELRKQRAEELKKEREEKLAENEKIEEDKVNALEQHKATIPPEEIEAFNEVQWLKNYDEQHPLVEIPPEIVDDIDSDI